MSDVEHLRGLLLRIEGRGYKAYKDIAGRYAGEGSTLYVDHVQGDPFATPSKLRVRVPQSVAQVPRALFDDAVRRVALQDFLARQVDRAIRAVAKGRRGTGKSGQITVDAGGQEVLDRTAVVVTGDWVEVRVHVGLPASGRRVLGAQAEAMLCGELPAIAERGLCWGNVPRDEAAAFVECVENQERIRSELGSRGLAAFVANGSVLPRSSGASDRPLAEKEAIRFASPESLEVTFELANPIERDGVSVERITGMGIPRGITLIVGGGYHGKSTLLSALERAVYPHVPGDGREYVVTDGDAVKIRAEDGRSVERVNISPFITNLPYGRSTTSFCSDDASGSTSQATNIMEALEVGARVLLLDEDTSATNFMVRDARMQALVHKEHEPITPFVDRVGALYKGLSVSTIMVMGGCGDYFDVADTVIMMREYVPQDVTERASEVARAYATRRDAETTAPMTAPTPRRPVAESIDPSRRSWTGGRGRGGGRGGRAERNAEGPAGSGSGDGRTDEPAGDGRTVREVKIDAKAVDRILYGREAIDLRGVEQLVDYSQTRAVGYAIHLATERFMDGRATLDEVVSALDAFFDAEGLDALDPFHRREHHPGDFARPRRYEIAAAINRLRTVRMRTIGDG